jgi:hypothetical protein
LKFSSPYLLRLKYFTESGIPVCSKYRKGMQKSFHKFAAKRALAKGTHVTSKSQSLGLKDSNLVMQF